MKTERGRGEEGQEQQRVRMIESGGERAGRKAEGLWQRVKETTAATERKGL